MPMVANPSPGTTLLIQPTYYDTSLKSQGNNTPFLSLAKVIYMALKQWENFTCNLLPKFVYGSVSTLKTEKTLH